MSSPIAHPPSPIPRGLKIGYALWMALWVPCYWIANGPANFLWLCDFANFVTAVGLWTENRRLLSSQLVGTAVIQATWAVDFFARASFGAHLIGGTEYMFREESALFLRGLSLFHLWTVPLLVYALRRLGYDRRGVALQMAFTVFLLPAGQWWGTPDQNLNWMWTPFGLTVPTSLPIAFLPLIGLPVLLFVVYLPTDWLARRLLPGAAQVGPRAAWTSGSSINSAPSRANRSGSNS